MLCWRFYYIHNALLRICCVGGKHMLCWRFYQTQHTFKHNVVLEILPNTAHFQTYVVLEFRHVVLGILPRTTYSQHILCWR